MPDRVNGRCAPEEGLRFGVDKVLLVPYALPVSVGRLRCAQTHFVSAMHASGILNRNWLPVLV